MAASPALPGLLLCFAATVLLIFVCVSSPTWEKISFLNVGPTHYGVFGFTGSSTGIGYKFQANQLGLNSDSRLDNINTSVINNLTKTLILHPIACGLQDWLFSLAFVAQATIVLERS
ncbi:hypothetical protein CPB85DRAFT_811378 [Mucidula mucida]|nr:hypothetical protein CPB85DRAFT_811378 [Mucidula mucida]